MSRQLCYFYIEPNSLIHKETMWLLVLVDSKGNITQHPSYDQDCFFFWLSSFLPVSISLCTDIELCSGGNDPSADRVISISPSTLRSWRLFLPISSVDPCHIWWTKSTIDWRYWRQQLESTLFYYFSSFIKIPLKVETISYGYLFAIPLADRSCVV